MKWCAEWPYGEKKVLGGREKYLIHRGELWGYGGTSNSVVGIGGFCLNMDPTSYHFLSISHCLSSEIQH